MAAALVGVATAGGATNAPTGGSNPGAIAVSCVVTGAKYFAAATTSAAICDRFVAAIRAATRPRTGKLSPDAVNVELSFRPPGIASARAVHVCGGQRRALPLYEMAVSDRKFLMSDVDKLAADVARGIDGPAKAGRN